MHTFSCPCWRDVNEHAFILKSLTGSTTLLSWWFWPSKWTKTWKRRREEKGREGERRRGGREAAGSQQPAGGLTWSCCSGAQTAGTLQISHTQLGILCSLVKTSIFIWVLFLFLPSFLQPSVGRTRAGKAAPWLGRTATPAEERRGKNKSTTSRKSLILRKSSARE